MSAAVAGTAAFGRRVDPSPIPGMTRCICGDFSVVTLFTLEARRIGRCLGCGLLRVTNPPDDYERLYSEGFAYHGERCDSKVPYVERYEHDYEVAKLRLDRHWHYYLGPSFAVPSLLDVGCANGAFVAAASDARWLAEGLEVNPLMAAFAYSRTRRPIHNDRCGVIGRTFDVITYHDVIEHMRNPAEELRWARSMIADGGLLVLDTPDAGHTNFVKDPRGSHHMKPREHLWFFEERHVECLLRESGFVVCGVERPIPGKIVVYGRPA